MLLTNREQEMIRLMMSQPAGVSRDELERQLVSAVGPFTVSFRNWKVTSPQSV